MSDARLTTILLRDTSLTRDQLERVIEESSASQQTFVEALLEDCGPRPIMLNLGIG